MFKKLFMMLLPITTVHVGDVVMTRTGKAYFVEPGRLVQMRVVAIHQVKETE